MTSPLYELKLRVYWEDTDGAGIVYYANYLKFLERARTEWLRSRGHDQSELARAQGVVFVVRSLAVEFLRPARLDDELIVSVSDVKAGAGTLTLEQAIMRGDERLVSAGVKLACVRIAAFQPSRIPRALRALFSG
ncbi:MAG: tol-pal system-associated acyl-CoA thioesterase [Burkholderiales bacterium]|nr:tol-pal system-associated acyl-CoA thioesterase [Burkholderiales bacterium]